VTSVLKRGIAAAVLGVAVLGALVGCDSATAGQAKPADPGERSSAPAETTTSKSTEPTYSLARLCDLLSADEAEELGGSAEGEEGHSTKDGHYLCTWSDRTALVVGYQEGTSLENVETGPSITNTPTTIDGLPAVQSVNTDTFVTCDILVALPSGRVVHATGGVLSGGEGQFEPCEVAHKLANLIIPRVKDQ
jgi:hypothetical protein